jgi:hypothetical protein
MCNLHIWTHLSVRRSLTWHKVSSYKARVQHKLCVSILLYVIAFILFSRVRRRHLLHAGWKRDCEFIISNALQHKRLRMQHCQIVDMWGKLYIWGDVHIGFLWVKPKGKRPLGRHRCRLEYNFMFCTKLMQRCGIKNMQAKTTNTKLHTIQDKW